MDEVYTYSGENVDSLSEDQLRTALKQCIHDLYQERRYKHTERCRHCGGTKSVYSLSVNGDIPCPICSTQNPLYAGDDDSLVRDGILPTQNERRTENGSVAQN